jgi:hypothetical protein
MNDFKEYSMIKSYYQGQTAKRSGVPLINHIDDGLTVMREIGATEYAQRAFALHPMFQADRELDELGVHIASTINPEVLLLVMEYRSQANAWLSNKVLWVEYDGIPMLEGVPTPGPLKEVKDMLIADKVQNYKDFLQFHKGSHIRSAELNVYFDTWLNVLGISQERFKELCDVIEAQKEKGSETS